MCIAYVLKIALEELMVPIDCPLDAKFDHPRNVLTIKNVIKSS